MTPPTRHNARAAAKIVGKSPSWMYQQGSAGNIPRSKLGHHVFWTDEQLTEILRAAAQEPKRAKQAKPREKQSSEQRQKPDPAKRQQRRKRTPASQPGSGNVPTADFSVSRLYRKDGAA